MRDISSFKERFQRWKKTGELPYEAGRIKNADSNREEQVYEDSLSLSALPAYGGGKDGTILNYGEVYESSRPLPTPVRKPGDMYDYQRAAELGYKRDTTGHFSTRDYQTGRYLKNPTHPTIMMSVVSDLGEGYYPYYNKKDGQIYSDTWMKMPEYSNGKDGTILNHDYANDVFTGAKLFDGQDIVVTGHRRPKPFKWVSPKGAGNMTVMPGDPEMVFFAPIAAGAGIAASPALSGLVSNVATPGSAFWTNPITKQLMVGTAAAEGVNKATKAVTGYNSVGEGVGASIEKATGWNPNSTLVGQLATEAFNPGWYLSPNAVLNTAGKVDGAVKSAANVKYAYDRNPDLAKIGTLEEYNKYLKTVFPESKVRDINYHMGPKGLQELKPSTGEVWNTNPDARGIYVTPDKSYAQRIRKYTTDRLEKPSIWTYLKRNLIPGGWNEANEAFTDIYPIMIDTRNPLYTKGTWTWGIKDKKYQSLFSQYDGIINAGPKWYQNVNSMPETIIPKTEQTLILGSDADVAGFKKFMQTSTQGPRDAISQIPQAALDFSDPSGRNRIEEMMYSPVLTKSKAQLIQEQTPVFSSGDVATDPYVDVYNKSIRNAAARYLDQIEDKPTPQEVIDIFNNSVLPRLQFMRPGYRGGLMYPTVKSKVDHTLSRGYTVYPKELFEKARGNDITVGLHYPETGHIGIKEGYEDFAGGHEFRHRLDKFLMKTDDESDILEAAYDDDFLKLSSLYDDLKDVRMGPEAVTTNFDARNAAIGKYHAANTDWKLQNKMIDKLSDEKIIEAVEKSNGYGRAYIDYLRKNNKLTSTKIHQFREAMKLVGMFAGAAPLLNPSKQK